MYTFFHVSHNDPIILHYYGRFYKHVYRDEVYKKFVE